MFRKIDASQFEEFIVPVTGILEVYEKLAKKDPCVLRDLIPSDEVWRFFIDGYRQQADLKQAEIVFDNYDSTVDQSMYEYLVTIFGHDEDEVNEALDGLYDMIANEMEFKLSREDFDRLTVRQIVELDKAWISFELREPGYLKALYKSFDAIFNFKEDISVELINFLHKNATENVKNTNYDMDAESELEQDVKGEFRNSAVVSFGVSESNSNLIGINELLDKNDDEIHFVQLFGDNRLRLGSVENIKYILEFTKKWSKSGDDQHAKMKLILDDLVPLCHFDEISLDVIIKIYNESEISDSTSVINICKSVTQFFGNDRKIDNAKLAKYLDFAKIDGDIRVMSYQFDDDVSDSLEQRMQVYVDTYKSSIKNANNPIDKLIAIVTFVRDCEQSHPYADGNCRTLCMLLLNHLLMRNGFPPAILDNPNRFDCCSIKGLLAEVVGGMKNTLTLIQDKKIYDISTKDFVTFLEKSAGDEKNKAKSFFVEMLKDFKSAVDVENNNRVSLLGNTLKK